MKPWLKILIGIVVTFIVVFLIGGFIFYNMLISSLPEYSGETESAKIQNDINIYTDSMAVPYIITKNYEDAVFALGYLHAEERLFQMDLARRAGEGRLSEIFGSKTLPFDEMFRTVGIKKFADENYSKMSSITKKLLIAYSNGVNFYIRNNKGHLPIEFDVLSYDPEYWKPEDCLVVIRMMAWELNISWWTDFGFTDLVQKYGIDKVQEIMPDYPDDAPFIIPEEIKKYKKVKSSFVKTDKEFREFMGIQGTHIGSNNWVINGKLSATGKPIIANDPHLSFSAPGKWYAAVIKTNNFQVAGVTLPGVPGIVIGENKNISWVLTNIMEDDCDFYFEKFDSTGTKYLVNDKWYPIKSYKDTIKVKDSTDAVIEINSTYRGPIISDIHPYNFVYNDKNLKTQPISMRWLGNDFSDETLAYYKINSAKNWQEFKEGVRLYSVPGQNFVYADKEGNIGYLFGARLPIRENNNTTFIFDGTTNKNDWKGFVPENQLPSLFNPAQNFIATANNKTEKNFKYHISNLWEPSSRIERIEELLTSKPKLSVKDYKKFQLDFISPYAKELTAYLINAFKNVKVTDKNLKLALELFKDWNYEMDQYSQVPAIYAVFLNHLLINTYMDEMGEDLYNEFVFVQNVPYRSIMKLMKNPESSWFDDIKTPQIETRDDIIRKSLSDALTELEGKFGKDLKEWQWGKLHKVIFKHTFSGFSSLVDNYIDIGPYSIGGDGTTIFNTEYSFTINNDKFPAFNHKKFENILGPSMRFIYDFSKPDEFNLILTTGQSGNVLSDHYRDMTKMWLDGYYLNIKTDDKSIKNSKNKVFKIIRQ